MNTNCPLCSKPIGGGWVVIDFERQHIDCYENSLTWEQKSERNLEILSDMDSSYPIGCEGVDAAQWAVAEIKRLRALEIGK